MEQREGNSRITSFRDLRVWQQAMDLVEEVYHFAEKLPKSELYGLASQLQRSAVSIPSNVAEGHTREHRKEFLHHLSMAQGSLAELETQVEIVARLDYVALEDAAGILDKTDSLGGQLRALRSALARSQRPSTPNPQPPIPSPHP